ncbi:MAG: hypothetical protein AB8B91_22940 [Rubripirellula sp.]
MLPHLLGIRSSGDSIALLLPARLRKEFSMKRIARPIRATVAQLQYPSIFIILGAC